jgi:hypothetical protein
VRRAPSSFILEIPIGTHKLEFSPKPWGSTKEIMMAVVVVIIIIIIIIRISHFSALAGKYSPILGCINRIRLGGLMCNLGLLLLLLLLLLL